MILNIAAESNFRNLANSKETLAVVEFNWRFSHFRYFKAGVIKLLYNIFVIIQFFMTSCKSKVHHGYVCHVLYETKWMHHFEKEDNHVSDWLISISVISHSTILYWFRGRREVAESAACFHEHPVLPQTSWTRECKPVPGLLESSTRDLRSIKQRRMLPCSYHAISCCPLVHCSRIRRLSRSISNNDIGIDFLAVDVAAIQDKNE